MTGFTSTWARLRWCSAHEPIWPTWAMELTTQRLIWTRLKYAGDGLFSLEEDIYNPANFATLLERWEAAQRVKP